MIEDHGEAVYASLVRTGAVRRASEINDFTMVELLALLRWLPPDSPLAASMHGGPHWLGFTAETAYLRKIAFATTAAVSKGKVKPDPLPDQLRAAAPRRSRVAAIAGAHKRLYYRDGRRGGSASG